MPVSTLAQAGADLCGGAAPPRFDLLVLGWNYVHRCQDCKRRTEVVGVGLISRIFQIFFKSTPLDYYGTFLALFCSFNGVDEFHISHHLPQLVRPE
jgi:hypothetical protein